MVRWSGGGLVTADCVISPAIDNLSYIRFAHREKLVALGVVGAEEKLPEIRSALGMQRTLPAHDPDNQTCTT
jgi:hypothetical protein